MAGASARVIYLSGTTGEVVQETTLAERSWNLAGAVIHWWYLPWLRRRWAIWDQTLWWVGALSTGMALTGVWVCLGHLRCDGWSRCSGGPRALHRTLGVIGTPNFLTFSIAPPLNVSSFSVPCQALRPVMRMSPP